MSRHKFLKSSAVIMAGGFFGFFAVQFFKQQPLNQNRFLASATMAKLGSEQYAKSIFDLKIKNEQIAEKAEQVSIVKVTVEAVQNLPVGLNYTWILPEGASLIEGYASGTLPPLNANQTQEFEIKLKGYSHDAKSHVVFEVKGDVNNNLVNRNVIVSSRPEDSFEYIVQENEKKMVEESKKNKKMGKSNYKSPIDPSKVVF